MEVGARKITPGLGLVDPSHPRLIFFCLELKVALDSIKLSPALLSVVTYLKLHDSSRTGAGPWNSPWSLPSLSNDSGKNSIMRSRMLEARERIPACDR